MRGFDTLIRIILVNDYSFRPLGKHNLGPSCSISYIGDGANSLQIHFCLNFDFDLNFTLEALPPVDLCNVKKFPFFLFTPQSSYESCD